MTVYVWRAGELVEKTTENRQTKDKAGLFPTPMLSRAPEPYASPIDGREITSWGQRDKDLRDSNSYDPRDMPRKKMTDERSKPSEQLSFSWTDPD
jgi:hypothetical protein